ncbi:MAG TPA: CHAT domain-containing protein, partial [Myxococcales bacterium]|nr:CHAT domain-containing protein [Myxococcales bacterium]
SQALQGCAGAGADYRCLQLHQWIAQHYKLQHRLVEAQQHAQVALDLARGQLSLDAVDQSLLQLGDIARLRGEPGRTRAFLEERVLRTPQDAYARTYLHESLAVLRNAAFDAAGARVELREAARAGPFTWVGAYTLSDIIRMAPEPSDRPWLSEVLAAQRARPLPEAERLLMDHIEGRALIDSDGAAGAALLRKSIDAAAKLPTDGMAQKVRTFSYRELKLDAGRRGAHGEVFRLLHEEGAAPESPACAVAVEAHDDRLEIAARNAQGVVTGVYRKQPVVPDARTLLPEEIKKALAGCQAVKAFASPPVHGQAGLFPDGVAWSYAGPSAQAAPVGPDALAGRELVVHGVEGPAELKLPRLAAWADVAQPGATTLAGGEATPQRVLAELADAGLVELHTHGLVDLGVSDASLLVLSPDASGRWALTAQDIRNQPLKGHPVVLLAACRAARVAPFFHQPWSLPRAFTDAGARAVIAAPVDLPDDEARQFFRGVVERLRRGSTAPVALRDERAQWLSQGRGDWVRQVLVFE